MDWLGNDRDAIGREKAGIARAGRPLVVGEAAPPTGLTEALARIGARVGRAGIDFGFDADIDTEGAGWRWWHADGTAFTLPPATLQAPCQHANAAAAIAALHALRGRLRCPSAAIATGVRTARLRGRLQRLADDPELLVDVAHNPQAARVLASWLDAHPCRGRVHAVYGALGDKDVAGVLQALGARIAHWHLAGLDAATPRGLSAPALAEVLAGSLPAAPHDAHADVAGALRAARQAARPGDRIVAFGSFFVASAVLEAVPAGAPCAR
jgi:dihydrofolate synthase/folylpolyglutamate synthase